MRTAVATALILFAAAAHAGELMQNSAARQGISLDGDWQVIVDPYENGFYNHRYEENPNGYFRNAKALQPSDLVEYDFAASPVLTVPGDWNTQREDLFLYEGTVWYQRNFTIAKRTGKRYVLYFGAANYEAVVYVNGEKAGRHEGGFTAFQFDVSDLVSDGDNFVVVKVDNRREPDNIPTVNTDWWNYGGLTRPVRLLELDASYVADWFIQLDPDDGGAVAGWLQLGGDAATANATVEIGIPDLGVLESIDVDQNGRAEFRIKADPERWTPENPVLYDVNLRYNAMTVSDRIGFRHVGVIGDEILLNGQPVYLRGISIHEEAPDAGGRAWSIEHARRTLTWAKELGCNFVRLAHYPHNEAIVRLADEMGLLVWSEIPVYWTIRFDQEYVYEKAEQQLREMISRDKNRAAIILWSVANETPNDDARFRFLDRLVTTTRQLDPTRLVTAALDTQLRVNNVRRIDDPFAGRVDVIGINSYCGWYSDRPDDCAGMVWESGYDKPVIVSEFGAGALRGRHGNADERWTEEYQASVYGNNIEMLENMPFVRGTTPWILRDFRSPRRPLPGIQDYWNRKGLLSEQGQRKLAWWVLRDYYLGKAD